MTITRLQVCLLTVLKRCGHGLILTSFSDEMRIKIIDVPSEMMIELSDDDKSWFLKI